LVFIGECVSVTFAGYSDDRIRISAEGVEHLLDLPEHELIASLDDKRNRIKISMPGERHAYVYMLYQLEGVWSPTLIIPDPYLKQHWARDLYESASYVGTTESGLVLQLAVPVGSTLQLDTHREPASSGLLLRSKHTPESL
jgi:hypothetical protein